jgi:hypothetical protein
MRIEVEIDINDYPYKILTYRRWRQWVTKKLKAAGVPLNGDGLYRDLEYGVLTRFSDPESFGKSVYVWRDNNGN